MLLVPTHSCLAAQRQLSTAEARLSPNVGSRLSGDFARSGQVPIGQRFFLSRPPVPLTRDANGQFLAFRPLAQLSRIFPISEETTYSSLRVDHNVNKQNQLPSAWL